VITTEANIPDGLIKRIHVDMHVLRDNTKNGTDNPVLTVQARGGPYKAHEVIIDGPSRIVYDGGQLSCGARCWIETTASVRTEVR
jgi:hypothetical protein